MEEKLVCHNQWYQVSVKGNHRSTLEFDRYFLKIHLRLIGKMWTFLAKQKWKKNEMF